MSEEWRLKAGDVVQLRSGSLPMTVEQGNDPNVPLALSGVSLIWMRATGEIERAEVPTHLLLLVKRC